MSSETRKSSQSKETGDLTNWLASVVKCSSEFDESQSTVCLRVPEMKNELSYWQLNHLRRFSKSFLKISSLRGDVKINTEDAGNMSFMDAESLGTATIHVFNKPVKVHVTRSKRRWPMVCDGFLGEEEFAMSFWSYQPWKAIARGIPPAVPIVPGEELIPDYQEKLLCRFMAKAIVNYEGQWADISERLDAVREYLPPEVANSPLEAVLEVLEDYADCFYLPHEKLTCTHVLKYKITLSSDEAMNVRQHKLSSKDWTKLEAHVDSLLQKGIVQLSDSPYNSPIRLIERKPDFRGNVRYSLAPDFEKLNKISESDSLPIADIEELTARLHGSKYFSVFDLASASYQIELEPEDRHKTAFSTRTKHYEFLRMPLGIKNASQNIQRLLNRALGDALYSPDAVAFASYDDTIVYAPTIEEHEVRVRKVLSRIEKAGLKLQPSKCQMFSESVRYLGYLVTRDGLRPDPEKVQRIRDCELPKTRHALSSFLGLVSFFKRFIPYHADRIKPMSKLFKSKDQNLAWTDAATQSFNDVKKHFSQELLLRYPNLKETFILETDVSLVGIRAALLQGNPEKNGDTFPIAYASRCYTPAESTYSTFNKTRLAAAYGMDTWHWYLDGRTCQKFILRTPEPRAIERCVRNGDSELSRRLTSSCLRKEFTVEALYPKK